MRRRIPLSKQLLLYVVRVAKVHPSVYAIALFGAFLTAAYSAFWGIAVAGIYQKWEPGAAGSGTSGGTPSYGAVTGLMVFAVFNLYYTTQFITCVRVAPARSFHLAPPTDALFLNPSNLFLT